MHFLLKTMLCFMHLEKSGGTSVRHRLEKEYAGKVCIVNQYEVVYGEEVDKLREILKMKGELLSGHFCYGFLGFTAETSDWVTVLREPVERYMSHYWHWKSRDDSWGVDNEDRERFTLEALLEDPRGQTIANLAVKRLAGVPDCSQDVPDQLLETAYNNLKKFRVIGFMDRLKNFNRRLHAEGFTKETYEIGWQNAGSSQQFLTDTREATREKIAEMNSLDIRLYNLAREHLDWE